MNSFKMILLAFVLFWSTIAFCQEKRDVLAVPGAGPTSFDLSTILNQLSNVQPIGPGYKIRQIFSYNIFNFGSPLSENAQNINTIIDFPGFNHKNVLGIGHDVGGLALRGSKNPKITGLILINVPNRGSGLLQSFFYPSTNQKDPLTWLEDLERLAGYQDCGYCDKMKNIKEFINDILISEPMLKAASDVPNEYVYSLAKPDPLNTAIIWSNANGLTLNDLIGRNNGLGQVDLQSCAEDKIVSSLGILAHDHLINSINGIAGINEISISARINRINDSDIAVRKNTMCRLSDRKLESDWRLRIVKDKVTYSTNPNPWSCESLNRDVYVESTSAFLTSTQSNTLYQQYCEPTFNFTVVEPTNLLYSKSEQTLGNEYLTLEYKGTHFDPIFGNNYDFLLDFFEGKKGSSYTLPK